MQWHFHDTSIQGLHVTGESALSADRLVGGGVPRRGPDGSSTTRIDE